MLCAFVEGKSEGNPTNTASADGTAAATLTPSADEDAEAVEIERLLARAHDGTGRVTNAAVLQEAALLKKKRLDRYLEELKHTQDSVGLAQKMALDRSVDPRWAVQILKDHWEDPRSEQALATIAQSGPHMIGELETPYGIAQAGLVEVRTRKQMRKIVAGKETEAERTEAIINYLQKNPELIRVYVTNAESYSLKHMLCAELEKSGKPEAAQVLLKSGYITPSFGQKHFQEMLEYARELPGEEAVSNTVLVERLFESGDKAAIPLLEKWLTYAKTDGQKAYLESAVRELRKTKKN